VMYAYPVVGSTVLNVGAWGRDNELAIDCGSCIEHAAQVVDPKLDRGGIVGG
jgi:hypothetical protein